MHALSRLVLLLMREQLRQSLDEILEKAARLEAADEAMKNAPIVFEPDAEGFTPGPIYTRRERRAHEARKRRNARCLARREAEAAKRVDGAVRRR